MPLTRCLASLQKCLRFNPDATVWAAKQRVLCSLNQSLKDVLNYGLFQPASNGRDGKFLDEERLLREYPQPAGKGVPSLEVGHWHPASGLGLGEGGFLACRPLDQGRCAIQPQAGGEGSSSQRNWCGGQRDSPAGQAHALGAGNVGPWRG